jgi:hypothetical protein
MPARMIWRDWRLADDPGVPDRSLDGRVSAWLEDEYLECHLRWRETCEEVRLAYRRWGASEREHRDAAFAAYRAALDQEECAARAFSGVAHRLRLVWGG